jgi:hypothetical protein
MMFLNKAVLASGAAAMLIATPMPAFAATMVKKSDSWSASDSIEQAADGHRRRHWRHRDRVDAGDIITGIGILAGIAIIADAASKSDKRDRDRDEPRYEERRDDRTDYGNNDLGAAVSACTNAAERSVNDGSRVREVRSVTSEGNGWRVEGDLENDSFTCATINGQVDYVRIEDRQI